MASPGGAPSRLQQLAPSGASLDALAPFYELGEKLSDERLASSLAWVDGALRSSRGPLGKLTVPERSEVLMTLLKAHPAPRGVGFEQTFPAGELSVLEKEVGRFVDGNSECLLGGARYPIPLQPPRRPATLVQLAQDYAGALGRIQKAPGRISREMQPDDREWAVECVRIEHCHLHRDPARLTLFRQLVGTFQDPAIAHVVMAEAETLPASRREGYLKTVVAELNALGPHASDWEKTRAEGARVKGLAANVQLVMLVARPEDDPAALLTELKGLGGPNDEHAIRGAHWRGPGQTWAQGISNNPETGLPFEQDVRLAQAICKRSVDRGEDHASLVGEVRAMGFRLHESGYLSVLMHALGQDMPLSQGLARGIREYELTSSAQGLSPVRDQISAALASGALKGDPETLLKRFELIYIQRTSAGEAKDKALKTSMAELLEAGAPGKSGVVQTESAIWVNGVRLRRAST